MLWYITWAWALLARLHWCRCWSKNRVGVTGPVYKWTAFAEGGPTAAPKLRRLCWGQERSGTQMPETSLTQALRKEDSGPPAGSLSPHPDPKLPKITGGMGTLGVWKRWPCPVPPPGSIGSVGRGGAAHSQCDGVRHCGLSVLLLVTAGSAGSYWGYLGGEYPHLMGYNE